jgi:hypothetical protein
MNGADQTNHLDAPARDNMREAKSVSAFRNALAHQGIDGGAPDYNTCVRFLKARQFDSNKAATMYSNMLQWRKEFKMDELKTFEFPELDEFRQCYPQGYHKTDKQVCGCNNTSL